MPTTIPEHLFDEIKDNFSAVVKKEPDIGLYLWEALTELHSADIATFLESLELEQVRPLYLTFPAPLQLDVFQDLPDSLKVYCLSFLDDHHRMHILNGTPIDELTDLFDILSDEELKKYLRLLHKTDRDTILSLLEFDPESAGGIMETDVVSLMEDYTVEKSVRVLQRLQPEAELHRRIFVTDQANRLVGCINLEDLVLNPPHTRISSFMQKNEFVAKVHEDQEKVARDMMHYGLGSVAVVDDNNMFLGMISSDKLVDILEHEASEDVYKMATMAPIKKPYFDTSFSRLLLERSWVLIVLLVAQTFSSYIIESYQGLLAGFLMFFLPMLISAGGNASSQTSAIAIQGSASGEIHAGNMFKFIKREVMIGCLIAALLGLVSFGRIIFMHGTEKLLAAVAVSCSLSVIVLVSVLLGAYFPFLLKRLNLDPAFSAGPGLATVMDILGLLIYCYIGRLLLG